MSVSTLYRIPKDLDVSASEAALRAWIEPQLEMPIPLLLLAPGPCAGGPGGNAGY